MIYLLSIKQFADIINIHRMASEVPLFFLLHCILTIPLAIQFIGIVSASPFSISQDHCGSLWSCTKGIELTVNTFILSTFLRMLTVATEGTYVLP